jgi:hypothetical protein
MSESDALSRARKLLAEAWRDFGYGPESAELLAHNDETTTRVAIRAIAKALSPPPPAVGGEVERLSQIASDMEDAVAHGMSWISHSECYDFTRRIRNVVEALTPQGGQKP